MATVKPNSLVALSIFVNGPAPEEHQSACAADLAALRKRVAGLWSCARESGFQEIVLAGTAEDVAALKAILGRYGLSIVSERERPELLDGDCSLNMEAVLDYVSTSGGVSALPIERPAALTIISGDVDWPAYCRAFGLPGPTICTIITVDGPGRSRLRIPRKHGRCWTLCLEGRKRQGSSAATAIATLDGHSRRPNALATRASPLFRSFRQRGTEQRRPRSESERYSTASTQHQRWQG